MSIETIDSAILAHRTWVARFQTALKGINNEVFDITKAQDDTACDLGRWLLSERSRSLLGIDGHNQIRAMHSTFHEIAGLIADKINRHEPHDETEALVVEFNHLSTQLVASLLRAKKKV